MNDSDETIWIEKHFDIITSVFKDSKYKKIIENSLDVYKWNSYPSFIFCLSEEKDILSQWRAYSQDGHGVCIGFSKNNLNIMNEIPSPNICAEKTLGITKVNYSLSIQKKMIKALCEKIKSKYNISPNYKEYPICVDLGNSLVEYSLVFKNPSFREEGEWRIIHTPCSSYQKPSETEVRLSQLLFRLKQNRIITYFAYSLKEKFDSSLIKEIVLGPKCQISEPEMIQFLQHHNLHNTTITQSKSTYR